MIIVDNSIMSFAFDLENGVPIKSFMGTEEDDRELLFLVSFLEEAFAIDDIQKHISDSFKLPSMLKAVLQEDDNWMHFWFTWLNKSDYYFWHFLLA